MELKKNKYYLIVVFAVIVYYTYAGFNGIAYWESANVKNTEYTGNRSHSGYGGRFYHK